MYIVSWTAGHNLEEFDRLFENQTDANNYADKLIANDLFNWYVSNVAIERF